MSTTTSRQRDGKRRVPAGTPVIDLSKYTGIPGMIDVHTHITYYWDETPAPRRGSAGKPRSVASRLCCRRRTG